MEQLLLPSDPLLLGYHGDPAHPLSPSNLAGKRFCVWGVCV